MDFFEHQERARRNTKLLLVFYALAVVSIIVAIYLLWVFIAHTAIVWDPQALLTVALCILALVTAGALYKTAQLSQGGKTIASLLGGQLINRDTSNPEEQKILHVVEEMAIAAGIPVPPVYVLNHESGINAFAAGFNPTDAVIGITRGALQQLSRDELQGVVAHEFSHIFNGDMRLNIRLMGILHGILLIALTGTMIMRLTRVSSYSRSSKDKGSSGKLLFLLLGLALMIIGYIGVFFANLIKSAVSRQREFLADAAAVQFTRYPAGIAGALKKIAGVTSGSRLQTTSAAQASHLFFANGIASAWFSLMATHPPLNERIRRLEATASFEPDVFPPTLMPETPAGRGQAMPISAFSSPSRSKKNIKNLDSAQVVGSVGTIDLKHLRYAQKLLNSLPQHLQIAARSPDSAQLLLYSLLLSSYQPIREKQQSMLKESLSHAFYQTLPQFESISDLPRELKLPLADMAVATLKELSEPEYQHFVKLIDQLTLADSEIDLFEYTLYQMIRRHLEPFFVSRKVQPVKYRHLHALRAICVNLISCLAFWGNPKDSDAQTAFSLGITLLGFTDAELLRRDSCKIALLDANLQEAAQASATLKKLIIEACAACVLADGSVSLEEAQVIRAVGDALDCPVPLLMAEN